MDTYTGGDTKRVVSSGRHIRGDHGESNLQYTWGPQTGYDWSINLMVVEEGQELSFMFQDEGFGGKDGYRLFYLNP